MCQEDLLRHWHFLQLVHHLRLGYIEQRDNRHAVDNLLHGAPLISLLRPDLEEPVRPRSPERRHAVIVEEDVLRAGFLGGGCFRIVAV